MNFYKAHQYVSTFSVIFFKIKTAQAAEIHWTRMCMSYTGNAMSAGVQGPLLLTRISFYPVIALSLSCIDINFVFCLVQCISMLPCPCISSLIWLSLPKFSFTCHQYFLCFFFIAFSLLFLLNEFLFLKFANYVTYTWFDEQAPDTIIICCMFSEMSTFCICYRM